MLQLISWGALALIHVLPAIAVFYPPMITKLYGVATGGDIFLLLHHRAALFLVIVVLCIWAAFDPAVRRIASVCVAISMISFLGIYWSAGSPPALRSIAIADLAGMPVLAFVCWKAFAA